MTMKAIRGLVIALIVLYAIAAARILKAKRQAMKEEKGHIAVYGAVSALAMFLGTFGLSDTAVSTGMYEALHLVPDKKVPGTIITGAVIPVGVMSAAFLTMQNVDMPFLTGCVLMETAGALLGVRVIVRLREKTMQSLIGIALLFTAAMILVRFVLSGISTGTAASLSGWKMAVAFLFFFVFGALNMAGIGATVPDMAILLLLGMQPVLVYPIVMTGNFVSCVAGAMRFLKTDMYSRKALAASVIGAAAVIAAVWIVGSIPADIIQIGMIFLMIICAAGMFRKAHKNETSTHMKEETT